MLVERWGDSYLGFVRELPGCQVEATDLDALVEAAPRVIASHLDWLGRRVSLHQPTGRSTWGSASSATRCREGVAPVSRRTARLRARRPSTRRFR